MQFWLKKSGTRDFLGPFSLEEIRAQIQSGFLNWDFEALEATGQSHGSLSRSEGWVPLSTICSPESAVPVQPPSTLPMDPREIARRQAHYKELRESVDLVAALSIGIVLVLGGINTAYVNGLLPTMIALCHAALGAMFIFALKHGLRLLIDIADTSLEKSREGK